MSQPEGTAELTRLNEKLRAEKEAAVRRAARRYKDMMHANRRAERAEQALKIETLERQDDKMKATDLFISYKETIHALKADITQAQQSQSNQEQLQAMQATNTGLEAALAQEKETMSQLQASANQAIRGLQAKLEADKTQLEKEADQRCEKRLAEMKKQLCEARATVQQHQNVFQTCKAENESLKQQLRQAFQETEWQKRHTQQQAAQRACLQSSQMGAGIHAGFPLQLPRSFAQVEETTNKRRRLDSKGYAVKAEGMNPQANINSNATVSTTGRQRSRANSIRPSASVTTPKREVHGTSREQGQPSHQLMTPTRQNTTPRRHQHPNAHASPLQPSRHSQTQAQASRLHAQNALPHQQLFHNFFQQLNVNKLDAGHTQLSIQEALPIFNNWIAKEANQQASTPSPSLTGNQPTLQHSTSMAHALGQGESAQAGLQSPLLPVATPFVQQTITPFNVHLPSSSRTIGATHVQQIQSSHKQQQQPQHEYSQSNLQSPAMSSQSLNNLLPALTSDHNADSPATFSNDAIYIQETQPQTIDRAGDMDLAAQMSLQLQNSSMYPSPEDSERARNIDGSSDQAQLHDWGSPASKHESDAFGMGNGQSPFGEIKSQNFGNNFSFDNFPMTTSASMPSTGFAQTYEEGPSAWNNQQAHGNIPQQATQHRDINPILLFNGEAEAQTGNSINAQTPSNDQYTSLQLLPNKTPTPSSLLSPSQVPPNNPPTPHAHPVPPPSTRSTPVPSTRSTPAPSGPPLAVCLHCHQNWWNETCDPGEPCQNCIGSHKACERPRCLNFSMGECTGVRCPRVHEGDMRYRNVVVKPKTLKRIGRKDERKPSPSDVARQQG